MKSLNLRMLWVAGLMLLAAFMAYGVKPNTRMAEARPSFSLEAAVPEQFDGWVTDKREAQMVVNPQLTGALKDIYQQVLSRQYVNHSTGQMVMVSMAYGPDQSYSNELHVPDICYPASGFQIQSRTDGRLILGEQTIPVRRLVTQRDQRREPLTYWALVGEHPVTGAVSTKLTALRYGVQGIVPDGMIVRFSTVGLSDSDAFELQATFARTLLQHMSPDSRLRIVGR